MRPPGRRLALIGFAAAAYLIGLWPTRFVLGVGLDAFGNPPYRGVGILIPHALFYSTLPAIFCLAAWSILARQRWLPPMSFSRSGRRVLVWGAAGGVLAIAVTLGYVFGTGGTTHAPEIDPWLMAGNVVSNFYEELIFRGFILVALSTALGFWPAAILSSLAFGSVHTQFPLELQALVGLLGFVWSLGARYARSLLAPYLSHMLLDWVVDPIL